MTWSACRGFTQALTRRYLLQVGGAGVLGLSLPGFLCAAERGGARRPRARSVIFLHQFGGPSHHDTLDMKPEALEAIRGELKSVATTVPGIQVCELLPRLARVADKFALVRSMHHTTKNHNGAAYYSLTGHA